MSQQEGSSGYYVDIVLCIDATGSMQPIIDEVKRKALSFHGLFVESMEDSNRSVEQVRIKVIVFRDYICDSQPMQESEFFVLPDENKKFQQFVNRIEACGGGDIPENALEALALAIKSDWTTKGLRKRHAIVIFSDAPALELGKRKDMPGYPKGIPEKMSELSEWWEGTNQYFRGNYLPEAGRLLAFVPEMSPWNDMITWDRYWPAFSQAGDGCNNVDIQNVIDVMVGSF